jgi:hypothetical protein
VRLTRHILALTAVANLIQTTRISIISQLTPGRTHVQFLAVFLCPFCEKLWLTQRRYMSEFIGSDNWDISGAGLLQRERERERERERGAGGGGGAAGGLGVGGGR